MYGSVIASARLKQTFDMFDSGSSEAEIHREATRNERDRRE